MFYKLYFPMLQTLISKYPMCFDVRDRFMLYVFSLSVACAEWLGQVIKIKITYIVKKYVSNKRYDLNITVISKILFI